METLEKRINDFFTAYEKRFNDGLNGKDPDVEGTSNAFSEFFVESSPIGVLGGKNDQEFRNAIPKGYAFYRSIGTQSMRILSKKSTSLDEYHCMVKVRWLSEYLNGGQKKTIEFDVIYFLFCAHGPLKIFAYITGDEQKALKENGLMPADAGAQGL